MAANKSNLARAKQVKNDEFYTQYSDINKEVFRYAKHLKDKIIYCNCDHPEQSEFYKFFKKRFKFFNLKKVITTHIVEGLTSFKREYDGEEEIDTPLEGDGDFRSDECELILDEADIVITNPPFSLFREFVSLLVEKEKQFLIIGNMNAITYKEIFKLIKDNKLWLGVHPVKEFLQPDGTMKKFGNICWFTNLTHFKRNLPIDLYEKYSSSEYPKYDNYDAIEVSKVAHIPKDYYEPMGVPITFLEKYCPEQFEILALGITGSIDFTSNRKQEIIKDNVRTGKFTYNAKGTLYRKFDKEKDKSPAFMDCETGELFSSIYARIIIKRKKVEEEE